MLMKTCAPGKAHLYKGLTRPKPRQTEACNYSASEKEYKIFHTQRTTYVKQNRWGRCRQSTNADKNIASKYLQDFSDHKLTRGHRTAIRLHHLVAARRHSVGTDFPQRDWQSTWAINSPLSPLLLNRKASHFQNIDHIKWGRSADNTCHKKKEH